MLQFADIAAQIHQGPDRMQAELVVAIREAFSRILLKDRNFSIKY